MICLEVTPAETLIVQDCLDKKQHPSPHLRNGGMSYPLCDEEKIMKTISSCSNQELAKYADLVVQAMGSHPRYQDHFQVKMSLQEWLAFPKNPTVLGNIAYMALHAPLDQRAKYQDFLLYWRIYEFVLKSSKRVLWGLGLVLPIFLLTKIW